MSFTDGFIQWFYWLNDGGLLKIFDQVNNVMPNEFGAFIALCLFCATVAIIVLIFLLIIYLIVIANRWIWKIYLNKYCSAKK